MWSRVWQTQGCQSGAMALKNQRQAQFESTKQRNEAPGPSAPKHTYARSDYSANVVVSWTLNSITRIPSNSAASSTSSAATKWTGSPSPSHICDFTWFGSVWERIQHDELHQKPVSHTPYARMPWLWTHVMFWLQSVINCFLTQLRWQLGVAPRLSLAPCFWHQRFCRLTPLQRVKTHTAIRKGKGQSTENNNTSVFSHSQLASLEILCAMSTAVVFTMS